MQSLHKWILILASLQGVNLLFGVLVLRYMGPQPHSLEMALEHPTFNIPQQRADVTRPGSAFAASGVAQWRQWKAFRGMKLALRIQDAPSDIQRGLAKIMERYSTRFVTPSSSMAQSAVTIHFARTSYKKGTRHRAVSAVDDAGAVHVSYSKRSDAFRVLGHLITCAENAPFGATLGRSAAVAAGMQLQEELWVDMLALTGYNVVLIYMEVRP
ncbi:hypothetical protein CYMTET_49016 [Cymbomonas tetramitiformis]|uniref:Uncharacterized protein n=1 Tax=Cymbomonas tetramitiformis TaxID=36881 RepID=A0AAE0BSB4_9CHLO|nr:hypothetical protein CYMTET_49016 [Cymbomonas tetramitiformis]